MTDIGLIGGYGFDGGFIGNAVQVDQQPAPTDKAVKPLDVIDRATSATVAGMYGFRCFGSAGGFRGFDTAPLLNISIMWRMRSYAAIALIYKVITGAIISGERSMEVADDKGNPELAQKMKDAATVDLLPVLARAMFGACESLHFGRWLQEVEWGYRTFLTPKPSKKPTVDEEEQPPGAPELSNRTIPINVYPILPGEATIHRYRNSFSGYTINGETRDARYGFLAVNDPHIDPIEGYSRNQNALEPWWRGVQSRLNGDKIERKASGVSMMLGLPIGQGFFNTADDGTTTPILPDDMAQKLVDSASSGSQVFTVPLTPFSKEEISNKPELANVPTVTAQQFNWGDTGPALLAQLERGDQCDRDVIRAWCRPEREATEGKHGNKAEAGVVGQIGIADSEMLHGMFVGQWDAQITRTWELTNFGPKMVGTLRTKPAPLADLQQDFLQKAWLQVTGGTSPDPEALAMINVRALANRVEVPALDEKTTQDKLDKQQAAKDAANAKKMAQAKASGALNGQPVNGKPANGVPVNIAASADSHWIDDLLRRRLGGSPALSLGGDDGGHWVTIDGEPVHINGAGAIDKGPARLVHTQAKSVSHAEEVLKSHGVKEVNLPKDMQKAQLTVDAVETARAHGVSVPDKISVSDGDSTAYASGKHLAWGRRRITAEGRAKTVEVGVLSQDNPMLHEMAHVAHQESAGARYDSMNNFMNNENDRQVAAKVSTYAKRNPKEFVAETASGIMSGKSYPDDVMSMYKRYGGPSLKRS